MFRLPWMDQTHVPFFSIYLLVSFSAQLFACATPVSVNKKNWIEHIILCKGLHIKHFLRAKEIN